MRRRGFFTFRRAVGVRGAPGLWGFGFSGKAWWLVRFWHPSRLTIHSSRHRFAARLNSSVRRLKAFVLFASRTGALSASVTTLSDGASALFFSRPHAPNNSFKPTPCRGVSRVLYATLAHVHRPATGRLNSGVRRPKAFVLLASRTGRYRLRWQRFRIVCRRVLLRLQGRVRSCTANDFSTVRSVFFANVCCSFVWHGACTCARRTRFLRLRCFGSRAAALFFSGSSAPNNSFKPTPCPGFVETSHRASNTGRSLPRSARLNSGVRRLKAFVLFASRTGALSASVTTLSDGASALFFSRPHAPNNSFKPTPCRGVGHVPTLR